MSSYGSVFDEKVSGCKIGFEFLDKFDFFIFSSSGNRIRDEIPADVKPT